MDLQKYYRGTSQVSTRPWSPQTFTKNRSSLLHSRPSHTSNRADWMYSCPAKPLAAGVAKFQEFCSRCFFLVAMGFFKGAKMKCVGGKGGGDLPTNWEYLKKKCTFKEVIFEFYKIYGVSMVPYFFHQWKNQPWKLSFWSTHLGGSLSRLGGYWYLEDHPC